MLNWHFGVLAIWRFDSHKTATPYSHKANELYNAKILLFGEHTVVKGSQALAMPLTSHFGTWEYTAAENRLIRQQQLPQFLNYLNAQKLNTVLNLSSFSKDLGEGLYFRSSIPTGYGLGSSGALCAAIYDRYAYQKTSTLSELKNIFGVFESYFHGKSSGMDPLVCYVNQPLLILTKENIQRVQIPTTNSKKNTLFLLDTHIPRKTSPFVNGFLERCQDSEYDKQCAMNLVPKVNAAITALLNNEWSSLYRTFTQISLFQFKYFDFMIPDDFKEIWKIGLTSNHFKLKICGAGGGGYLLGMSREYEKTQKILKAFDLIKIK